MGAIEQFGSNTAVHEEDTDEFDLFDAMLQNGLVDMESYDQNFARLVEHFGSRVFRYGGYSGTVADMIACPPFQDQVEAGFDAAVAWLEAHDGQGDAEESDDDEAPVEDELFGLDAESQLEESPPETENSYAQPEREAHKEAVVYEVEREAPRTAAHDKHTVETAKAEDRSDSADESVVAEKSMLLEDVRQEIAEVFADIENEDDRGEAPAEMSSMAIGGESQHTHPSESLSSDVATPLREAVAEDTAIVSVHDVLPELDVYDEDVLPREGTTTRHEDARDGTVEEVELPEEIVVSEGVNPLKEAPIELVSPTDAVEVRPEGLSEIDSVEASEVSTLERDIEVAADELDFASEEPVAEWTNDQADDSVLAEAVLEADDPLVPETEGRTYADVLDIEMREDEVPVETNTVEEEPPVFIKKEQRTLISELQPEARAEVYAVAARAEHAATSLLQATTEAECHEARAAMAEEIVTLLELLGYDSPRETMAEILKTYDIGELRELLQHFLSANRVATGKGHDWLSRVSSYIAAHAILIHNYETFEVAA